MKTLNQYLIEIRLGVAQSPDILQARLDEILNLVRQGRALKLDEKFLNLIENTASGARDGFLKQ